MVVGAFPAFKLGALLLKQVSKPIASVVKHNAKTSPFFRKYICMPPAQCTYVTANQIACLTASHFCFSLQLVRGEDQDVGYEPGQTGQSSRAERGHGNRVGCESLGGGDYISHRLRDIAGRIQQVNVFLVLYRVHSDL